MKTINLCFRHRWFQISSQKLGGQTKQLFFKTSKLLRNWETNSLRHLEIVKLSYHHLSISRECLEESLVKSWTILIHGHARTPRGGVWADPQGVSWAYVDTVGGDFLDKAKGMSGGRRVGGSGGLSPQNAGEIFRNFYEINQLKIIILGQFFKILMKIL